MTNISECIEILQTPFSYFITLSGDIDIQELKRILFKQLEEILGTRDFWQKTMSDIMRHNVICGSVDAGAGFGRVHIDNACVQVSCH